MIKVNTVVFITNNALSDSTIAVLRKKVPGNISEGYVLEPYCVNGAEDLYQTLREMKDENVVLLFDGKIVTSQEADNYMPVVKRISPNAKIIFLSPSLNLSGIAVDYDAVTFNKENVGDADFWKLFNYLIKNFN